MFLNVNECFYHDFEEVRLLLFEIILLQIEFFIAARKLHPTNGGSQRHDYFAGYHLKVVFYSS